MGKELVIRDEQTIALAERVAAAAGESVEAAVRRALQAVEALYPKPLTQDKVDAILSRARALKEQYPEASSSHDHLYDEAGLPK